MLGSIIGAIGGIAGGLLGNSAAKDQMAMQKQFAQNGIRWKVEDAKRAGIHPLYALGAPTMSYSPVATGDYGVSQASQDIGRAIDATRTAPERDDARLTALHALALERGKLENDSLRLDLASKTARLAQQTGPAMPGGPRVVDGQGDAIIFADGTRVPSIPGVSTAQQGEDRWGEIGGELVGAYLGVSEADLALAAHLRRTLGQSFKAYTPAALGARAGDATRRALFGPRTPHSGAGESW